MFFYFLLLIILAAGGGFLFYHFFKKQRYQKLLDELQLKLLAIKLVKSSKEGKDLKQEINISEQLFNTLASIKKPFIFEAAVPYVGEEIIFYLAVPASYLSSVERQIQAFFPASQVEPVEDYNIFNYYGVAAGALVFQKEKAALPIKTYQELNSDTFSPILGGLSKVNVLGEGGAIQVVVQPALPSTKKEIAAVLKNVKKGGKITESAEKLTMADISEALSPSEKKENKSEKVIDESAIKAVEMKLSKPLFQVNVRLMASATNPVEAQSILESLAGGFSQFASPERNFFKITKPKNLQKIIHQFSFREFDSKTSMVLNSEELVSIFHLPTVFTEVAKIKWLKSKEAEPPANLPEKGLLLGTSLFRGQVKPVYLTDKDRRRHLYIIGQTGTGKSVLLSNMVSDDIKKGKGAAIIDPHGDTAEAILSLVPQERFEDVVIFDPSDLEKPVGLNMLEYDFNRPEEKTFIVNEMLEIFDKLYDLKTTGGPMFEQYLRNALQLLMEDMPNEPATLTEVPRIFTDADYRERKLSRISNPIVVDFWTKEAIKAGGEAALQNVTPYITSKFNVFLTNDYVRPIIGQFRSTIDFRKIMDEGKILIVNLSKGRIGNINANLLGMVIIGKLLKAAFSRVDTPESERQDFYLYIDEFQNFSTDSIATILSEARKYRLDLIIAHQFIAQLTEKIRDAVFGNVGSMAAFRISAQDAEFVVKQFEPIFTISDLINIDNFNAHVKLLINNQPASPFNIKTPAPLKGDPQIVSGLKKLSRLKYGRNRQEVEKEIYLRLRT